MRRWRSLSAREFVRSILVEAVGVVSVHEGGNFRFGHNAEAGVAELKQFGAEFGFAVHVHAPVRVHGLEVSSSAIRALVAAAMCAGRGGYWVGHLECARRQPGDEESGRGCWCLR